MTLIGVHRAHQSPQRSHEPPVLRAGSRGTQVEVLQRLLVDEGANLRVSGTFGPKTKAAVRQYQRGQNLQVDGVVGHQTWGALSVPVRTSSKQVLAESDLFVEQRKSVSGFVKGKPKTLSVSAVGDGQFMRVDAATAFLSMKAAAQRVGITVGVRSGFRTMAHQQEIYLGDKTAARPGYSNHQRGPAVDINGIGGRRTPADKWLRANAEQFGFRNLPSEFWHYDFVAPRASTTFAQLASRPLPSWPKKLVPPSS